MQPETYGTLDEGSSALGLAKALTRSATIQHIIENVQEDLRILNAELACERGEKPCKLSPDQTSRLERCIEELQAEVEIPRHFIQPGTNVVSASVDLGRAIIRRAERRAVALREAGLLEQTEIHAYLNRLSDCLFVLARYAERYG